MNLFFSIFCVMISAFSCQSQTGKADFHFQQEVYKFGKVKAGKIIEFSYTFTNNGTDPLIISDIKVTCGCTVPAFPKEPVAPGQKSVISVKFDTKGKIGYQDRTLEIFSNARKNPKIIRFKGTVISEN
jgi:hypothetical protein